MIQSQVFKLLLIALRSLAYMKNTGNLIPLFKSINPLFANVWLDTDSDKSKPRPRTLPDG